jgi:hypothetical protein
MMVKEVRSCVVLILVMLLGGMGCVPAKTPQQLTFTPGAVVMVTDKVYQNEIFWVAYPARWRVITAPAETPDFVIFAAPENQALVMISASPIEEPPLLPGVPSEQQKIESRTLPTSPTLYAALVVDEVLYETLHPLFDAILETVMPK